MGKKEQKETKRSNKEHILKNLKGGPDKTSSLPKVSGGVVKKADILRMTVRGEGGAATSALT